MSLQYLQSPLLNIDCLNLSCSTINGLPPGGGGGSQNIQQVLTVGDDAGNLSIQNLASTTVINYGIVDSLGVNQNVNIAQLPGLGNTIGILTQSDSLNPFTSTAQLRVGSAQILQGLNVGSGAVGSTSNINLDGALNINQDGTGTASTTLTAVAGNILNVSGGIQTTSQINANTIVATGTIRADAFQAISGTNTAQLDVSSTNPAVALLTDGAGNYIPLDVGQLGVVGNGISMFDNNVLDTTKQVRLTTNNLPVNNTLVVRNVGLSNANIDVDSITGLSSINGVPYSPNKTLSEVLTAGNTIASGLFIDATGLGSTAIDATGSDIIAQNIQVEKITPLGAPIITNLTLDGGLTLQTGGNYRVEFEDEIRIGKGLTDFIYTDPTDGLHLENAPDVYVDNLHYNTLTPAPPAPISYQTFYANLGDDLQTALTNLSGGTRKALFLSTGSWSYTGTLSFDSLDTCAICGQNSFTPQTRITPSAGFQLEGATSTRNQFRNIAFNGLFSILATQGRHRFQECEFMAGLTLSGATSNFLTFNDCELSGVIDIPATFAGSITFVNCNFQGTTLINLNQSSAQQVIFTNCINLPSVNEAKCVILGLNQVATVPRVDTLIGNFNGVAFGGVNCEIDPLSDRGFVVEGIGGFINKLGGNQITLGIDPTGSGSLRIDGTGGITTPISGSSSGNHLRITINGTPYVIELKNP